MESGMALLLDHGVGERVHFVIADHTAVSKWSTFTEVLLWQAVALHCRLDPDAMGDGWDDIEFFLKTSRNRAINDAGVRPRLKLLEKWSDCVHVACQALDDGLLPFLDICTTSLPESLVSVDSFYGWALRYRFPSVVGFSPRGSAANVGRWPWGSHSTPNLDLLAKAGELWRLREEGGNFDPENQSTAPTIDKVAKYLGHDVPPTVGRAVASLLRPPWLRSGPRPRIGTERNRVGSDDNYVLPEGQNPDAEAPRS
jgi:hypothetical protein